MSRFKPATRERSRLRMAIDGPSGSGKSFTALRFAHAFPDAKIFAIDTENGSLAKYMGEAPDGKPFAWLNCCLSTYSPSEYAQAIEDAGREGADVLIVDSLSHAWSGKDGALEMKDKAGGNQYTAWKDVTPQHNRMVEAILTSPCHVIITMRAKTEYVLEEEINERGAKKQVPRKIGMAPIQRPGMEYEFDVYASMDWNHVLRVTKSRCSIVQDVVITKPGASFMGPVIDWLNSGTPSAPVSLPKRISAEQIERINSLTRQLEFSAEVVKTGLQNKFKVSALSELMADQADAMEAGLLERVKERATKITVAPPPEANFPLAAAGVPAQTLLTATTAVPAPVVPPPSAVNGTPPPPVLPVADAERVDFPPPPEILYPDKIAPATIARIDALFDQIGMEWPQIRAKLKSKFGKEHYHDFTPQQGAELEAMLTESIKKKQIATAKPAAVENQAS